MGAADYMWLHGLLYVVYCIRAGINTILPRLTTRSKYDQSHEHSLAHICYFVLSDTGRVMVVYSNRHNIIDKLIASFHWYRFSFDRIASSASLSIILFCQWFSLCCFSLVHSFTFFCIIISLQRLCYHGVSCFHPRSFWPF